MASTAAWSTSSLSPLPMWRAAAMAAASVTRTNSMAMLRSMGARVLPVVIVHLSGGSVFDSVWLADGRDVHTDVQGLDGVGQRAYGYKVDASGSDGSNVVEGNAAGSLQ